MKTLLLSALVALIGWGSTLRWACIRAADVVGRFVAPLPSEETRCPLCRGPLYVSTRARDVLEWRSCLDCRKHHFGVRAPGRPIAFALMLATVASCSSDATTPAPALEVGGAWYYDMPIQDGGGVAIPIEGVGMSWTLSLRQNGADVWGVGIRRSVGLVSVYALEGRIVDGAFEASAWRLPESVGELVTFRGVVDGEHLDLDAPPTGWPGRFHR